MCVGGEAGYNAHKYKIFGKGRYKISAIMYIMKNHGLNISIDMDDKNIIKN